MAFATPNQDPVYFAKRGLLAWKRILTRSRGATTVFAYESQSNCTNMANGMINTHCTSCEAAGDTGSPYVIPSLRLARQGERLLPGSHHHVSMALLVDPNQGVTAMVTRIFLARNIVHRGMVHEGVGGCSELCCTCLLCSKTDFRGCYGHDIPHDVRGMYRI